MTCKQPGISAPGCQGFQLVMSGCAPALLVLYWPEIVQRLPEEVVVYNMALLAAA